MGRLVFGMMQSLDGYIAAKSQFFGTSTGSEVPGGPVLPPPGPALHRHFNDHVRGLAGMLYGTRMYEVMRYWDEDQPDWDEGEHDFAAVWRREAEMGCIALAEVGGPQCHAGDG